MKFYLIVLNYNNPADTIKCVNSIIKQRNTSFEIVVVDNKSSDNSYNILLDRFEGVNGVRIIMADQNNGYAQGNNFGLRFIEEIAENDDIIVISNNDIILEDELTLFKIKSDFESIPNIGMLGGGMMVDNQYIRRLSFWNFPRLINEFTILKSVNYLTTILSRKKGQESLFEVDCVSGAFFAIKYETFKSVQFFDPKTFLYMEETILARKLRNRAYKNYVDLNITYDHHHAATVRSTTSIASRYNQLFKSKVYYYRQYTNANKTLISMTFKTVMFLFKVESTIIRFLNLILNGRE